MNPYDLRTPEEKLADRLWQAHLNGECKDDCEWCNEDQD
jgi:hypothetical protein